MSETQNLKYLPNNLTPTEYRELNIGSCIHPDLIALNFYHLEGDAPLEQLFISEQLSRRNTGIISHSYLKQYRHVKHGGWWCNGVDVLNNFTDDLWGQFKPNTPRLSKDKGKIIKYEAPPKYPTGIFALRVSEGIWDLIAKRCQVKRYLSPLALRMRDRKQPVSFWEWVLKNPEIPLIITEGSKKAAALLSLGHAAIALPGIFNGYRQPKDQFGRNTGLPYLIPQLEAFATPGRKFYFAFDQDPKPETIQNVNQAILKTGRLLEQKNCSIQVITWSSAPKGVDDLIRVEGAAAFEQAYNNALSLEAWQAKTYTQLTYPVNIRLNQRYLVSHQSSVISDQSSVISHQLEENPIPEKLVTGNRSLVTEKDPIPHSPFPIHQKLVTGYRSLVTEKDPIPHSSITIPQEAKLIAIKSPKNTGKTYFLEQEVQKALYQGQWVLVLGHRVQLVEALCQRFGIPYLTEVQDSDTGTVLGYGLCVDSLHPHSKAHFKAQNWQDGMIIIDEAEQVFWHLLASSTCISERVSILRSLKTLIQNNLSGDGKVYIADADLSDLAIDYVRSLAGFHLDPFVIVNDWKPTENERWNVHLYEGTNPSELVAALVEEIKQGGKPFINVSAQKTKSQWGTQNLEAYLRQEFPSKKILRIDSESVADPEHPAYGCIAHLNEVLPDYDLVIASPAIETGVSIECKRPFSVNSQVPLAFYLLKQGFYLPIEDNRSVSHFTSVWTIAQGVQPADSVRQSMARVRANVPRHLWAAKRGFNGSFVGNGATSVKSLLSSQQKLARLNMQLLMTSEIDDLNLDFQPESLKTWAKRATVVNLTMQRYRASIVEGLMAEGHCIHAINDEAQSNQGAVIKEQLKQVCENNYEVSCQVIATMDNPTDSEYQKLKEKRAKTPAELKKERKGDLSRRYGVEVTPELVQKDDQGWYSQLLCHYYLTMGRKYLQARDLRQLQGLLSSKDSQSSNNNWSLVTDNFSLNDVWLPDMNRQLLISQIRMLEVLGVMDLLVPDKQYRQSDKFLIDLANVAKANKWEIKACLNVTINDKDSPIAIAQLLLSKLGIKLQYVGRLGSRGDRERVYTYIPPTDGRDEVFATWLQRDEASV